MTILIGTKITLKDGTTHKACLHDKKNDCENCSLNGKNIKHCKEYCKDRTTLNYIVWKEL